MTANATHPGRITIPGTDIGVRGTLVAEPQTENMLLELDDRLAQGPVKVDTDHDGVLQGGGLVVPILTGIVWLLRFEPHKSDVPPFSLGIYNLNTSGVDLKDLVAVVPAVVDETLRVQIAAAAALGATNDTATASFVTNPASATDIAIANKYASRTSRVKHDVARGLYFPEAEGAVGNGSTDDRTAIQAAITTAAAAKGRVVFSPGVTYACATPLTAVSDVTLELAPGSKILRTASHAAAFIANSSYSTKINRFRIVGPGVIGSTSTAITGQVLFLWGDDLELSDFTIDTYAGGQAVLIGGDRNRMRGVKCINPDPVAGVGGIRMYGGTDFVASQCHVIAGDDALQFTPVATAGHPLVNLSINRAVYVGCTGGSAAARFQIAALSTSPPGSGGLTNSITNSGWIGCQGYGKNRGLVITNTDSTGEIANVFSTDCSFDMTGATANTQDILVNRSAGTGRVRTIRLSNVRVIAPAAAAFGTTGVATSSIYVEDVILDRCTFDPPTTTTNTIKAFGVDGLTVRNCRVEGITGAHVISDNTGANASKNIRVENSRVLGCSDTFAGVRLSATTVYRVQHCKFEPVAGSTTANGVSLAAATTRGYVTHNDFTDLPAAGVTGTIAAGTIIRDNTAYLTKAVGTDTISAASTSKAVTHGLAATPTSITVTGAANEVLWVSAKNATTFTVTRNASGVAHTFNFIAEYQP